MRTSSKWLLVAALCGVPSCEAINAFRGMVGVATEIGKHLEDDLKSELTDAKIAKVVEVTPKLKKFSETAKVKWEVDPHAPDFSKLASAMGGLADYIAFFEGEGTRITEFYVDLIKIQDARGLVTMKKAYAEATEKLDKEKAELEAKLAAASGDAKQPIEDALAQNKRAREELDKAHEAQHKAREEQQAHADKGGYKLSDAEVARVEAHLPEIEAAFKDAGWDKSKS
ncbi:MAG TPA: hypothetical protein VG755_35705 [Nannocystaceae bacterium]|nr:hypothetical protein [Nannocystaceae bacterium]